MFQKTTVKKVNNGKVSTHFVDELSVGDTLEVMPPEGRFVLPSSFTKNSSDKFYFYAAGSGITPILGLIKTILKTTNQSEVVLHYGNFDEEQVIFKDELKKLEKDFSKQFNLVHHYTNLKLLEKKNKSLFGRIFGTKGTANNLEMDNVQAGDFTVNKLQALLKKDENMFSAYHYICGPGSMIPDLEKVLLDNSVSSSSINHEYFAAAADSNKSESEAIVDNSQNDADTLTANLVAELDGEIVEISIEPGETILRGLIDAGYNPPYSCESGVCATCICTLKKGKVTMKSNMVLSDDEVSNGYILSCQSVPITSDIEVEYPD